MFGKQSKITLMILALCLISLLILGVGFYLWQQQYAKTGVVRNEISQLVAKKAEIIEKLGPDEINIKNEGENLIKKKASLQTLEKSLMDYQYIPSFLTNIQRVAKQTGNELVSIAPGEVKVIDFSNPLFQPAPKPGPDGTLPPPPANPPAPVTRDPEKQYKSMPITITMKGTYISNVKFIDSLRKFPQIIYIKNFTLAPNIMDGKVVVNSIITANALIVPDQYKNSIKLQTEKEKQSAPAAVKKSIPTGAASVVTTPNKEKSSVINKTATDKKSKPAGTSNPTTTPEKVNTGKPVSAPPGDIR